MATLTRPEGGRSPGRWGGPLLGVATLALGGAAFALVIHRQDDAWRRSFARVVAEPPNPSPAQAAPPVEASAGAPTTPDEAIPESAPAAPEAVGLGPPAPPPEPAPAPMPAPIVLHIEPATDSAVLDARAAGTPLPAVAPAASAAPSASASVAPSASTSAAPAASSAPSAAAPAQPPAPPRYTMPPVSVSCGPNTCNVGEICCNPSCGTCIRPGAPCDDRRRCSGAITFPESQSCGLQTCNVGLVCCNPSCGICAEPGQACSDRICG